MPSKSCQSQSFPETQQCRLMLHVSSCSYSMLGSCSATPEAQLRVTQVANSAFCSGWRIKPPCSHTNLMRPAYAEGGFTLRLLCTKTSVLQSPQMGICKSWFLNLHPGLGWVVPAASPALETLMAKTWNTTESKWWLSQQPQRGNISLAVLTSDLTRLAMA